MFVVRAGVLLDLLAQWHPELAAGLRAIAADPSTLDDALARTGEDRHRPRGGRAGRRVTVGWPSFPAVSAGTTWATSIRSARCSRTAGEWQGSRWSATPNLVVAVDATGVIVPGAGRTVAVVGVPGVVVVDTPDALLVTTRERAQDVKAVVDPLKSTGRTGLT